MEFTPEELNHYLLLRALEWKSFPVFIGMGVGQFILLYQPAFIVLIEFVLINFFWGFICLMVVSHRLSSYGIWIHKLMWVTSPGMAIWFFLHGSIVNAIVALFWAPILMKVAFVPIVLREKIAPRPIGYIQQALLEDMPR